MGDEKPLVCPKRPKPLHCRFFASPESGGGGSTLFISQLAESKFVYMCVQLGSPGGKNKTISPGPGNSSSSLQSKLQDSSVVNHHTKAQESPLTHYLTGTEN